MADEIELLRLVSELIPEPTTDAWVRAKAAIAAAREEDLLRQDTKQFTRDPRVPAGRTRRVALRRRRRLALRSVAAVAAALAAGAVALVAVVVPGARHNGAGGVAGDTAYVVKRVDSALSAAGPAEIAQMTITARGAPIPGSTTNAEEWSYGGQWRSVTYSPAGHPLYDEGFGASSVYTLVSYLTRTWAGQPGPGRPAASPSGPRSCEQVAAALPSLFPYRLPSTGVSASSLPAATALRAAVTCGTLSEAGWQHVDGIEAIELTSRPGSLISETIWVSPVTYLPVRVVVRSAPGQPVRWQAADITWLPPTAQNLANTLIVPIPRGFPRVPLPQASRQALPPKGRPRPNVQVTSAGARA